MDFEEAAKMKALEKFMEAVAQMMGCLPSYSDPHPDKGNAHIIERLRHLTNRFSGRPRVARFPETYIGDGRR